MSAIRNVAQSFRNLWGQGGDEYEDEEDMPSFRSNEPQPTVHHEEDEPQQPTPSRYTTPTNMRRGESPREEEDEYPSYTQPPRSDYSSSTTSSSYGSGSSGGTSPGRRLRPVAMPIRGREKNVYTLKPKSMDEASVAADYLKTGCAVILNLDDLTKGVALRMVDFMSGVCYGLDTQGHAMKLGATIFLFTPGDYEITSDEADYGENRDPIFRDEIARRLGLVVPFGTGPCRARERTAFLGALNPKECAE